MSFGPIMRFQVGELSIELGPLAKTDMAAFVVPGGGMNQASVTRYLARHVAYVLEDEEEWFERTRLNRDLIVWGIWLVEGETRTLIGNSALSNVRTDHVRTATSGSLIFRKDLWGKGIASAAHKARTWYAFRQLGLHLIKSEVIQGNGGSLKALERSGYIIRGVERNIEFVNAQLTHADMLECYNPDDPFWSQWWHGDRPPAAAIAARQLTREILSWAEAHVELA